MEKAYRGCAVNIDNFDSFQSFMDAVARLDKTSSPGYPFMMEKPTIGEWLGFNGCTYNEFQIMLLWNKVTDLMNSQDNDILWRVFIKQEPHKIAKIENKRYRLIMSPPLHVQVLWQMLFSKQNDIEIARSYYIPSQQGIIMPYGGWKKYYSQWLHQGTVCGTDATAWDWTFPGWMILLDLRFRKSMIRGLEKYTNKWERLADRLYQDAFRDCKIIFSSGRIFQQTFWGIMKSGCVNTISTNSHGGFIYHILYCLDTRTSLYPLPKCVGDDQLQHQKHLQDVSVYEKYGKIIKSISDTIEFVGHEFHETGPRPMYIFKHLYNLMYQDENLVNETLDSYFRLYANYDYGFDLFTDISTRLGLSENFPSRRWYKRWYNSPDGNHVMSIKN